MRTESRLSPTIPVDAVPASAETAVIRRIDPHADFSAIVRCCEEKVRNTCFRFVENREDADDLAQEVFMQVYESMHHFREDAELSTWMYRIAVNKALDFLRRRKRKKRFVWLVSLGGEHGEDAEVPDSGNDPHRELEAKELKQILHSALERLPESQKTAIILSEYEHFQNRDIASIMDVSVASVESLLHRARRNLRSELSSYFEKNT